jgi:hypothetical protein
LALIAPVNLHVNLDVKYGLMGDYHLLLAHQVLEHKDAYFKYYYDIRREGRDPVIIMDNSLIELGRALQPDALAKACETVGARYLVLPDVMSDPWATIDKSAAAYTQLKGKLEGVGFMGVLQGKTLPHVAWCMNKFSEILGRDLEAVSVPRVMVDHFGSRLPVIKIARDLGVPIHLLGFSKKLSDDLTCAFQPGIMGIDSAYPIWSGREEIVMRNVENYDSTARRPDDFWTYQHIAPAMVYNIMKFREWFKQ